MFWATASSLFVIYLYRKLAAERAPAPAEGPLDTAEAELAALEAQIATLEGRIIGGKP